MKSRLELLLKSYNQKKKWPIFVLIGATITILAGLGDVLDFGKNVFEIGSKAISNFNKHEEIYKKLQKVNTGLSSDYIDQLFGKPSIIRPMGTQSQFINYIERLYVSDLYFLYTISEKSTNKIFFYSVTTRDENFNPLLPMPSSNKNAKLRLGKATLTEIEPNQPQNVSADASSKFISYTELDNFGNRGYYKDYVLGYAPAGYTKLTDEQSSIIFSFTELSRSKNREKNKLQDFRKTYSPNSFGVIGEINDNSLYEILSIGMIGIDYFDAREFPKDSS